MLCSIDQAEKHPHGIRQWLLHAVELLAFGLTNKLAFALIHDHDWFRVAHPHVALPQAPERFMEGMRGLPLAPLMSRWQEADGARGQPRTPLDSRERHYSLQFPPVMGHRRTSVRGQANLDRCH
jgi:hypothetical protein